MSGFIIGVAGKAGAGKDTAAAAIIKEFNPTFEYAFARPIKEAAKILMGWTDEHVRGELKEVVDPLYGVSPRYVMQTLGTEWGRKIIKSTLWTLRAKRFIETCREQDPNCNIVITDVRFDSEASFIIDLGGAVLNISRPSNDKVVLEHSSEDGVSDCLITKSIINDGTVVELHEAVIKYVFFTP
tara:strand:- start:9193 stop:9744 length:552 start_codon:yes stop_codon:yes gene_type:complete